MKVFSFLKKISNELNKEAESFGNKYRVGPFKPHEMDMSLKSKTRDTSPVSNNIPEKYLPEKPVQDNNPADASLTMNPPSAKAPFRRNNNPSNSASFDTPEKYLEYLKFKYNQGLKSIEKPSSIVAEDYEAVFSRIYEDNQPSPADPFRIQKEQGLEMFKQAFESIFSGNFSPVDNKVQEYPDIPEETIRAMIKRNQEQIKGQTRYRYQMAWEKVFDLPEIRGNDNNVETMNRIKEENTSASQSELSEEQRSNLEKVFMDSYLNTAAINAGDRESYNNYMYFLGQKKFNQREYLKDVKELNKEEKDRLPNDATSDDFDSLSFLKEKLFFPDNSNKDLFLSFFLESYAKKITDMVIGSYLSPEEHEILNKSEGSYKSKAMQILQNNAQEFYQPLIDIMQNKSNGLHKLFFAWVMKEIKRDKLNTTGKESNESSSQSQGSEGKSPTSIDTAKAKSEVIDPKWFLPLNSNLKDIFQEEINSGKTESIRSGKGPDFDDFERLKNNWNKINGFIIDVLSKSMEKYESTTDKSIKTSILQKSLLWERMRQSAELTIKHLIEDADRNGFKISGDTATAVLNQNWDKVFKREHLKDKSWDRNQPDIKNAVNKMVEDGLVKVQPGEDPYEVAYNKIAGSAMANYIPNLERKDPRWKDQESKFNAFTQNLNNNMSDFGDILTDPELLKKHGYGTSLSFADINGTSPQIKNLAVLLSKNNKATFEDKVDYLAQLVDRGVNIGKTRDQLESMSPNEISSIFSTLRDTLEAMYGQSSEVLAKISSKTSKFTDDYVKQLATSAGHPEIDTKEKLSKIGVKSRVAQNIKEQFFKTEYGKYYIEQTGHQEALKEFVAKAINEYSVDSSFLSNNGFSSKEDFFNQLGIPSDESVLTYLDNVPKRNVTQIAKKYFPSIYDLFLQKKLRSSHILKYKKMDIKSLVSTLVEEFKKEDADQKATNKVEMPAADYLSDALVFADILDAKSREQKKEASVSIKVLNKIAMQKKLNSLILLKNRLEKVNADTYALDIAIRDFTNGRK